MVNSKKLVGWEARRLGSFPAFQLSSFLAGKKNQGFTMTELIVASLFAVMVMATLYSFYRGQLYHLLSQEAKTATLEDARGALDLMVRELRNAGAWSAGTQPPGCSRIVSATATSIQIQADLDGQLVGGVPNCNSMTGEDVTYQLSGSTIRRNGPTNPLVSNVVIPSGSSFLSYYKADGSPTTDLSAIKRVRITLSIQLPNPNPNARSANPNISTTLSSGVEFRN